jgi:hypothetical protein
MSNYYPDVSYRPNNADYSDALSDVMGGWNGNNNATGNASGSVGFNGGPMVYRGRGDRYGIEGPDMQWAAGSPDLVAARSRFSGELNDPSIRQRLFSLAANEDSADPRSFIASLLNRAASRGQTLDQAIGGPSGVPGTYTGSGSGSMPTQQNQGLLAAIQSGDMGNVSNSLAGALNNPLVAGGLKMMSSASQGQFDPGAIADAAANIEKNRHINLVNAMLAQKLGVEMQRQQALSGFLQGLTPNSPTAQYLGPGLVPLLKGLPPEQVGAIVGNIATQREGFNSKINADLYGKQIMAKILDNFVQKDKGTTAAVGQPSAYPGGIPPGTVIHTPNSAEEVRALGPNDLWMDPAGNIHRGH